MSSEKINVALLSELKAAESIIRAMLNVLTGAQKSQVAAQLVVDGCDESKGLTRAAERRKAIEEAEAT